MDKMTIQEMLDMELNTEKWNSSISQNIVRVPNGWIYLPWDFKNDQSLGQGTFVPEPKEKTDD